MIADQERGGRGEAGQEGKVSGDHRRFHRAAQDHDNHELRRTELRNLALAAQTQDENEEQVNDEGVQSNSPQLQ